MQLKDFIEQTQYQEIDSNGEFVVTDEDLLIILQNHTEERVWRIQGQVRKTQVETAIIVNDTMERLNGIINDSEETPERRAISKALFLAFSKLYEYEFYINLNDPTVSSMFEHAQLLNVLNESEATAITSAATYVDRPFESATLEQVRALRYPTSWKPVAIASGNSQIVTPEGDLINTTNNGAFRFIINTDKAFTGAVNIRILAKKADDTVFLLQDSFPISINKSWESNTTYAHVFKRALGLSGYRHFKFEVLAPFEGAIASVEVEGVA